MTVKVGIDFGTSNSGVAAFDGRQVRLLPIEQKGLMPEVVRSILYITRDGKQHIGQEAVELYYQHNINRQRRYVKQWAGEITYTGADMHYVRDVFVYVDELKPGRLLQYLKTALRKGPASGYEGTQVFDTYYRVSDLVQAYLVELKRRAEDILGEPIGDVTLGRPVKFSESPELDRKAEETLRQAALAAGFRSVEFELEPVAAALYYERSLAGPENVLIFDFGGGTLDIAIMRLGDLQDRHVYASGGIDIAGSDFDRAIIQKRLLPFFGLGKVGEIPEILELVEAVPDWMGLPELATPQNRNALQKAIRAGTAPVELSALESLIYDDMAFSLYGRVETAKIALSETGVTTIALQGKNIDLWELYSRSQFEADIRPEQEKIETVLVDTIRASGLEPARIDAVVKTGGSSSIPLFTTMLERIFEPGKIKESSRFSSVVAGLAIRAME